MNSMRSTTTVHLRSPMLAMPPRPPRASVRDLADAIEAKDLQRLEDALDRGAPVNGIGPGGQQPIFLALKKRPLPTLDVALALVEAGADVFARDEQRRSPLSVACLVAGEGPEARSLIELMLHRRASTTERDELGRTPLLNAAIAGNAMAADLLLRAGASVFATDAHGATSLHLALASLPRERQATSTLMERLLHAARGTPGDLARLLAPNETHGISPLGLAAIKGDARTCELLLAAGAPSDRPEPGNGPGCRFAGRTPQDLAGDEILAIFDAAAQQALEREADAAISAMFNRLGLRSCV
ncbi:hypothetical protein LA345_12755 [Burkholderia vietnamiensis]|uniref:Ankyrin n=1 Tax=Burkholderia vietnamiensis (strain G4 / LMG 22486) TaxID=269482 RepID=A4JFH0_BURVG|nr:Ankyrin [Burkholderia vietnamiensis G4]MCB4344782.1 hypothetical protein [Burkholderia vietnamiensis]